MTGSRFKYRFEYGVGKIRHLGSMPEEAIGLKAQLSALSEGNVLVRKARNIELKYFLSYRKKNDPRI